MLVRREYRVERNGGCRRALARQCALLRRDMLLNICVHAHEHGYVLGHRDGWAGHERHVAHFAEVDS